MYVNALYRSRNTRNDVTNPLARRQYRQNRIEKERRER